MCSAILGFCFGVFCGAVLGVVLTALLAAGNKDDRP